MALAVVAVAGGIVAIGIAVRADQAAPGPPPTAGHEAGVPGTSPPATTVRPGADRASSDWPVFGYDAARTNVDPRPTGVTAASVAGLVLTTEVMMAEAPKDEEHSHGGGMPPGGMGGMDM